MEVLGWDSTAPMPELEASVATSNNLSKSGRRRIGAERSAILIYWKARSVGALNSNWDALRRSVRGAASELKFLTNRRWNWARPWKLRTSNGDLGIGQSRMAAVLPGSTAIPAAEMTNPRNVIEERRNAHLLTLATSFSS